MKSFLLGNNRGVDMAAIPKSVPKTHKIFEIFDCTPWPEQYVGNNVA